MNNQVCINYVIKSQPLYGPHSDQCCSLCHDIDSLVVKGKENNLCGLVECMTNKINRAKSRVVTQPGIESGRKTRAFSLILQGTSGRLMSNIKKVPDSLHLTAVVKIWSTPQKPPDSE